MVTANMSLRINALDNFGTPATRAMATDPMAVIRAAGADFDLESVSLNSLGILSNDDLYCVRRSDDGRIIGQVGNQYAPMSNRDFFVPLAEALIEHTGARIERFAELGGGNRAFMRLMWEDDIKVGPNSKVGDVVGRRATLHTGHDGKWAGKLSLQMLRLICLNGMLVPVGKHEFTVVHSKGGVATLADIVRMIPRIDEYTTKFKAAAGVLIETPVTPTKAREVITSFVDPKDNAGETKNGEDNKTRQRVNRVWNLFNGGQPGAGTKAMKGTAWGVYNALTDDRQYGGRTSGDNTEAEKRFKMMLPGGSANRGIIQAWDTTIDKLELRTAINAAVSMN